MNDTQRRWLLFVALVVLRATLHQQENGGLLEAVLFGIVGVFAVGLVGGRR
jgi:hypothetical protein